MQKRNELRTILQKLVAENELGTNAKFIGCYKIGKEESKQ